MLVFFAFGIFEILAASRSKVFAYVEGFSFCDVVSCSDNFRLRSFGDICEDDGLCGLKGCAKKLAICGGAFECFCLRGREIRIRTTRVS